MSKELKALRMLEQVCLVANVANMSEQINLIETALKALEIIKEKDVDINWLKRASDLHCYNMGISIISCDVLSQDEYELLREVLL